MFLDLCKYCISVKMVYLFLKLHQISDFDGDSVVFP
jgi:hypothetical protein